MAASVGVTPVRRARVSGHATATTVRRLGARVMVLGGLSAVAAMLVPVATPSGAAVAAPGSQCAKAGTLSMPSPWVEQLLTPDRAWPFARGAGQVVAVLDSGVDHTQPQLLGHVATGFNAVANYGPGNTDCLGTGTAVAGAIVAQRLNTSSIYGVAPGATIEPVKVISSAAGGEGPPTTPAILARGITWAVNHHVDVIDISVALSVDDPGVRSAVANAVANGITVVAAVGDQASDKDGNPTPYPSSYPGVIGVGAIASVGQLSSGSSVGPEVKLVAPGGSVPAVAVHGGLTQMQGTSTAFAAGSVAGTAALVRAHYPNLSMGQIADRLFGTAMPPAGGFGPQFGYGIVDPYNAVTDTMVSGSPSKLPAYAPRKPGAAEQARLTAWAHGKRLAMLLTVSGLGALVVVVLFAVGLPRARRRDWRPTYAPPLRQREIPDEPLPPALLFEDPADEQARA